ncbi:universal stress protein [Actinomycetospora termitidis]|uniref:Universal stress protein n=1 Tax=Actinomycetospora termitidis TaxID=3053470 RepID=A0ABT7M4Z7_9PSEU|nr:universal stress protein [Actinomycetospora sp. Odt1-22]MDL5155736.1 universal stress protein [Actinomycetospora sp. Odt1-22]
MGDYKVVTVGTDGSSSARKAVVRAAEVAADSGAHLMIICAYETRDASRNRDQAEAERALGDEAYKIIGASPAEETLRGARDEAIRAGATNVDTVAVQGDPADAIIEKSELYKADLVVVGNKGLASFAGRLLGSVPQGVSRRSRTDVLIVHTV